jgi:acetoacetyl-CoA reductase
MSDDRRIAVVTGGIQGIGAASCRTLAERGFRPVATHLGGGDRAKAFAEETGFPVYEWDVSDYGACETAMAQIREEQGPIDVLVNNAGVNRDKMFHKMSREEWDAVIQVDLGSMFNVTRQVIGEMRDRGYGRIINLSSVNAQRGQLGQTNYSAAKAGVIGFTKALARESASKGITVNALAPGYTETPMVERVPDEIMDNILKQVPVGRLAEPHEVARCVAFLASEDAGFITGATISVNGGLFMN